MTKKPALTSISITVYARYCVSPSGMKKVCTINSSITPLALEWKFALKNIIYKNIVKINAPFLFEQAYETNLKINIWVRPKSKIFTKNIETTVQAQ